MNKLDLIIDALEKAKDGWQCFDEYEQALAAAKELRELKPVAWMLPEYGDVLPASQADGTGIYNIPLYTAPPRKEWVGLTDEDKELLITLHAPPIHPDFSDDDSFDDLLSKHEAKLKELNAAPTAQMGKEK